MPQREFEFVFDPPTLIQLMSADEIFEQADEDLLLKLKEDRRIERKTAQFTGGSLGEYVSMWANTAPEGGLIVSGQRDKGRFEGLKHLSADAVNKLEKNSHTFCPEAKVRTKKVAVTNDRGEPDFVLLHRVEYNPDVVVRTSSGKVFVRKGDSCTELKADEIRELQADKGEVRFELNDCGLPWPEAFDLKAVDTFVDAVREARGMAAHHGREAILELRHLGKFKEQVFIPNYACALLFAKDPVAVVPGCKIHFQRFEGEVEGTGEQYNAVKDVFLEGTVPSLIQQMEKVLESQLRTFAPLDSSLKFFPVAEYPKSAWYEAVVNACVHRSYGNGLKNMPIFVKMFDDRLVIESPGPFPPFVTPTNIYEMHHPRNPSLMDALFYLSYVRCAHEGTRRIREVMVNLKLPPPEFQQSATGPAIVRVILRNNVKQRRAWIDHDVSKIISSAIAADLTEEERRALNLAAVNESITVSDANKLLNIPWQSARKILFGLARKRVFQYVRYREFKKDKRDPKSFFRLRSTAPLPEGAFEQDMAAVDEALQGEAEPSQES